MIAYFPEIYPDELVYSQLARFYTRSGYITYSMAAEILAGSAAAQFSIEFLNQFTAEACAAILKDKTVEEVVMKHTMFPYFGRFLPYQRRKEAFIALCSMDNMAFKKLAIPRLDEERFLRYCPVCVNEDRRMYGETYWHRMHQMSGVDVCPVHGCGLCNSKIRIGSGTIRGFWTAEEAAEETEAVYTESETERELSAYVNDVFQSEMDLENRGEIKSVLHNSMSGTKYLTPRGERRNRDLIKGDLTEFYRDCPNNWLIDRDHLNKIFNLDMGFSFSVCMMAYFLGVSVDDLVQMKTIENPWEAFDRKVWDLHSQGLPLPMIASKMEVSEHLIRMVVFGSSRSRRPDRLKGRGPDYGKWTLKPWDQEDQKYLEAVRQAVMDTYDRGDEKPGRVTVCGVARMIGIPVQSLKKMQMCLAEVYKYQETQEEYWAREAVWAAGQVRKRGMKWQLFSFQQLVKMNRKYLEACLPYIRDAEIAEEIARLLGE